MITRKLCVLDTPAMAVPRMFNLTLEVWRVEQRPVRIQLRGKLTLALNQRHDPCRYLAWLFQRLLLVQPPTTTSALLLVDHARRPPLSFSPHAPSQTGVLH